MKPRGLEAVAGGQQSVAARLASLVCPTYFGPSVTPLAEPRKRVRRQGLALRVTRLFCRGRDASPNASFCHAHVVYFDGEDRRATATGTLSETAQIW
jgi:hypothetical protein